AGAASAGREEDELVDDLLGAHPLLISQVDQELHQVADGEVRRVALGAVSELLADPERLVVRAVHRHDLVPTVPESTGHQVVVSDGEAADEHGDLRLLRLGEGEVRHVLHPLLGVVEAEAGALLRFELPELGVDVEAGGRWRLAGDGQAAAQRVGRGAGGRVCGSRGDHGALGHGRVLAVCVLTGETKGCGGRGHSAGMAARAASGSGAATSVGADSGPVTGTTRPSAVLRPRRTTPWGSSTSAARRAS